MNTSRLALVGAFVLVFGLTVAVATIGGLVLEDNTPKSAELEQDHWDFDVVEPQAAASDGAVTMDTDEPSNTVVVHVGVAQAGGGVILVDGEGPDEASVGTVGGAERDVGPLTTALVDAGHDVVLYRDSLEDGPLPEALDDADAFVSTQPDMLGAEEVDAVEAFADAGGRTVLAADPGSTSTTVELASSFGLYTSPGYVYDMQDNDLNHLGVAVEPSEEAALTEGVDRAVLRGVAPVGTVDTEPALVTSDSAQLSTTREHGPYGVAGQSGDVAVIGDSSFLSPENAYRADNDVLVGNVADFLVTGDEPEYDAGDGGSGSGTGTAGPYP